MLDLRRLEALVAVADHGSVSAAATTLGLSQPAVSHHLARLEAEVGMPLLVRHARGVRPTAAGDALLVHARGLLDRARAADDALGDLRALRTGRVDLLAFPTAFVDLVPRAIQHLREEDARFDVRFGPAARGPALAAVAAGTTDLALVFAAAGDTESPRLPAGLVAEPLMEDPMLVVLAREHPLAGRAQVSLADLADERWVLGTARGPDAIIRRALVAAGIDPSDAIVTDDLLAAQGIVAAGLAVTLSPALAVAHARPGVVLRALAEPQLSRRIDVVRRAADTAPAIRATTGALRTIAEELAG
ncbi:LysR family transcriptional regulator [Solirubrobacter pauli]|uniref:LysR family transcriptional regulator n=1 Tax=Solirubrobacter pauli TaxID=166793 RepID=A0A660L7C9_9ACTN|nr:LysR family transcriptional regulator [Solirubrobacter pauli]RKQ90286.1 LysR family transcriptional regulator [Solirubrobacter pauli]